MPRGRLTNVLCCANFHRSRVEASQFPTRRIPEIELLERYRTACECTVTARHSSVIQQTLPQLRRWVVSQLFFHELGTCPLRTSFFA